MNQPLSVKMRRYEVIGGVVWLIFYGFFMGDVLALLLGLLGIPYTGAQLNAVYFLSNFVITALLFRRFLAYSLPVAADHLLRCLKAMLLGGGGVCGDACASLSWPDGCAEHLL